MGPLARLCGRFNGRVERTAYGMVCAVETESVGTLDEYIDEFVQFVRTYGGAAAGPVGLMLVNRMLGGDMEYSLVVYDPVRDAYMVEVRLASESTLEAAEVERVKPTEIERKEKVMGTEVEARGYVVQNPATDEFYGVAVARSGWVPGTVVADVLKQVYRRAYELAARLAERALEALTVPA